MHPPSPSPAWFVGTGPAADLIRCTDWGRTPLGPIDAWPIELRVSVGTLLGIGQPSVIWWGAGRTQIYNDAYVALLGARHPDAMGRGMAATWPEVIGVLDEKWCRVVEHGETATFADQPYDIEPDGVRRTRWFTGSWSPIRGADGSVVGVLGTAIETTARIDAERINTALLAREARDAEALREAARRKDEFLAMLAHELRGPLVPVVNGVSLLERMTAAGDTGSARVRDMMRRHLRHLVRLVDDLLDVGRITHGKVALRREPVRLADVLQAAARAAHPPIDGDRHRLRMDAGRHDVVLLADEARLVQVFANLLGNAARYTPEGGRIELDVEQGERVVRVRIRDDGIGIAPEHLDHVFEPFTQLARDDDGSAQGLGLGLTVVRMLVDLHGGRVWAASDGPGTGTSFTVELPVTPGAG